MKVTGSAAVHMATVSKSFQEASATRACSAWAVHGEKVQKFPRLLGLMATGIGKSLSKGSRQKKNLMNSMSNWKRLGSITD